MKIHQEGRESETKSIEQVLADLPVTDEQADEAKGGNKGEIYSFNFGVENPGSFAGNR